MDITDGVKAAELVQPGCAIPMHYDTFDLIKADPQEYVEKVKKLGIDSMILKPGESITW
jgi:L-ascorbate metabolism protein UlaG (beta-lactamase superfamily)